jgi:hypothetical protein
MVGVLAILGPRRMPYARLLALATGTARRSTATSRHRQPLDRADRLLLGLGVERDAPRPISSAPIAGSRANIIPTSPKTSRGGGALQRDQRGLRSPQRSAEAPAVRSLRYRSERRGRPGPAASAGSRGRRHRRHLRHVLRRRARAARNAAGRSAARRRPALRSADHARRSVRRRRARDLVQPPRPVRDLQGHGRQAGHARVRCDRCGGTGAMRSVRQTPLGQFVTQTTCTKCGGEGTFIPTPCETCRGRGRVERPRTLTVKIPAGVDDGSRIRVSGSGEGGTRGGPPGDLYVYLGRAAPLVPARRHRPLRRRADRLHASGARRDVEIETLDGGHRSTIGRARKRARRSACAERACRPCAAASRGDLLAPCTWRADEARRAAGANCSKNTPRSKATRRRPHVLRSRQRRVPPE